MILISPRSVNLRALEISAKDLTDLAFVGLELRDVVDILENHRPASEVASGRNMPRRPGEQIAEGKRRDACESLAGLHPGELQEITQSS